MLTHLISGARRRWWAVFNGPGPMFDTHAPAAKNRRDIFPKACRWRTFLASHALSTAAGRQPKPGSQELAAFVLALAVQHRGPHPSTSMFIEMTLSRTLVPTASARGRTQKTKEYTTVMAPRTMNRYCQPCRPCSPSVISSPAASGPPRTCSRTSPLGLPSVTHHPCAERRLNC